jgi:hypothetical protein
MTGRKAVFLRGLPTQPSACQRAAGFESLHLWGHLCPGMRILSTLSPLAPLLIPHSCYSPASCSGLAYSSSVYLLAPVPFWTLKTLPWSPSWRPSCSKLEQLMHDPVWSSLRTAHLLTYFHNHIFFSLFLWDWSLTQDIVLIKQVLYCWSHPFSSFCSGYFGDGSLTNYLPGLASNHNPPNLRLPS